jgi:regulator of sigma E protease
MDALVMAGQLILGLSILVGLHELGHLLAAKMFGMKVEQFSIGFPPKIFGVKYGETEYSIGAIPLGGFVKISGMIDESLDMESMSKEPQPWEFRAKPAWQRLIVMAGGIIVNIIVGILIFVAIVYTKGERYLPASEIKYGIVANELAEEIGLQTGDKILKVNGQTFEKFDDLRSMDVLLSSDSYYTVERNGEILDIPIPNDFIETLSDNKEKGLFLEPIMPFEVGKIAPGSEAEKIGLKPGDRIVSMNNQPVKFFHEYREIAQQTRGKEIPVGIRRNGETINKKVNMSQDGTLGFYSVPLLKDSVMTYSLVEAIPIGAKNAFNVVYANIQGFGKIFRGEVSASKSVGGPIMIAQIFGGTWDWLNFWQVTGLLSMVLAFMNALPIPALDGGHITLLSYEMVSGRKPSDKFLEVSQKVGMVLLLGLMAFAIFNDVFKMIF